MDETNEPTFVDETGNVDVAPTEDTTEETPEVEEEGDETSEE